MMSQSGPDARATRRSFAGLLVGLVLGCAAPLSGEEVQSTLVVKWRLELRDAEALLKESKWRPARRKAEAVLDEMENRFIGGGAAGTLFGGAVFLRAVAAAGLGDDEQAYWDYQMAIALNPNLQATPLSDYGTAGRRLAELEPDPPSESRAPGRAPETGGGGLRSQPVVTPPEVLHKERPRYLVAQRIGCVEGVVVAQVIVDKAGRVLQPRVLTNSHPILAYAALDALRHFRFRPAHLEGRPVTATYNLTVNFRLDPQPPPGSCSAGSPE